MSFTKVLCALLFLSCARQTEATFRRCNKSLCRQFQKLGLSPKCCRKFRSTKSPTMAPKSPTNAPLMNAPLMTAPQSTKAPTKAPSSADVPKAPVRAPLTPAPVRTPTRAPVVALPPAFYAVEPRDCSVTGMVYGDPHIATFDGLSYACQGEGEYVLYASEPTGGRVHARFTKSSPYVSLVTAVAVQGDSSAPLVQVSISQSGSSAAGSAVQL